MHSANDIFCESLALLGEAQSEESEAFRARCVPLVNLLIVQLAELDAALLGRAVREEHAEIRSLDEPIGLKSEGVRFLLPVGLAALLIEKEDPARSSAFLNLDERERSRLEHNSRRGRRHKIR